MIVFLFPFQFSFIPKCGYEVNFKLHSNLQLMQPYGVALGAAAVLATADGIKYSSISEKSMIQALHELTE